MATRLALGLGSFLAVLLASEIAFLVLGTPRGVGPVVALALSTLLVLDPGQLISEPRSPRRETGR